MINYLTVFIVIFFFLNKGELLSPWFNVGGNWAYVFDQLGIAIYAVVLSIAWYKKKLFPKGLKKVFIIVAALVLVTHYHSLYRAIFDEWFNVIQPLKDIHYASVALERVAFYIPSQRYAWAPFAIFYELVGFDRPYSLEMMSMFGIIMMIVASILGAWLSYVVSRRKVAALLAGLLIGISPNSISSLPWPSSVQGDSLGIILVCLSVGFWFIGRKNNDSREILLSLIFFAAALKGGGSVRTITSGALLIITDILLFTNRFKKRWIFDWIIIFVLWIFFYITTEAVHMTPRAEAVPLIVRGAQMMELTTKSFVPPTILASAMNRLLGITEDVIWVAIIGIGIFVAGTIIAVYCLFKEKLRLFSWGWAWFYLTAFYAPWFAEGYGSTLESINDRYVFTLTHNAGFKYAYLPLVGLHVTLAIFIAKWLKNKKWKKIALIITLILIVFRSYEFVKLDKLWRDTVSTPNRAWQKALFSVAPLVPGDPANPKVVVFVDGKNDPIYSQIFGVENGLYDDKSVLLLKDVDDLYQRVDLNNLNLSNVYAFSWDNVNERMVDLTDGFRNWLSDEGSITWETEDFSSWRSNVEAYDGVYLSEKLFIGKEEKVTEPSIISPDMSFVLPNPRRIRFEFEVYINPQENYEDSDFVLGAGCNSVVDKTFTIENLMDESLIRLPIKSEKGNHVLIGETSCGTGILRGIHIISPTHMEFKPIKLKITTPHPEIEGS